MLSVKSTSILLPRCLAVVIFCLWLAPAEARRSLLASGDFTIAAEQNARFKLELNWTFGGRPQRGWYLYTPLIQRLLNTDSAPETTAFAEELAVWQRSAGLAPTGGLDQPTWLKMVGAVQSRRRKGRPTPAPDGLTTVRD